MKKRMAVSIALTMALILLFVGCAQADMASAWDYPELTEGEAEYWELDDFFDDQEERYYADPESYEAEPYSEPAEETGTYMDLDGRTIVAMAPFEGGVGWIQYMENGEMYTAAVETDGHVLFEIPGPVWYASPFEDDAAFVVISDNATYYPNADPTIGCYEQVAPAQTHEEIYDIGGNLLYSTATVDAQGSHIICAGDGKYVVLRHHAGLEFNSWQLGVIGQYGELLRDFAEYENVGGGLLPTWRTKYSGTGRLPNMYGAGYGNGNDGDEGDGFPRYIGEGVYYLTGGSSGILYAPDVGLTANLAGTKLLSDCFNGVVLSVRNGSYYTQNVFSGETATALPLESKPLHEDIGNGRVFRYDHFMVNDLYYHDHGYYNAEMERMIDIASYASLQMDGSIFNEGFALIFLVGMDGNTYTTVIDDEGTVQFEPIRANKTSGKVSDGYFVVQTDTECAVYDVTGDYIRHLCSADEGIYIRDVSGGHVTMYGLGANRIYSMYVEQWSEARGGDVWQPDGYEPEPYGSVPEPYDSEPEPEPYIAPDSGDPEPIGNYVYNVTGTDFICRHNIDDYIYEKDGVSIFDYISLAEEIGWRFAGYKASTIIPGKERVFMYADDYDFEVKQVMFEGPISDIYSSIHYVFSESGNQTNSTVYFTRVDLTSRSGSGGPTYYLNSTESSGTINRDMAVVACYLLENITPESDDNPLEAIYGGPGPYNP